MRSCLEGAEEVSHSEGGPTHRLLGAAAEVEVMWVSLEETAMREIAAVLEWGVVQKNRVRRVGRAIVGETEHS